MIERLERAEWLDGVGSRIGNGVARLIHRSGSTRDVLSGTPLGHPLHPALVSLPLGMWSAALVADLARDPSAAQALTAAGLIGAVPAVATGLSDWLDTAGAEQRVGLVHMGVNLAASAIIGAGWLARRRNRERRGLTLGATGLVLAGAGGWLGGHLVYALGVGVDSNAFDGGPVDWTELQVEKTESDGSGQPMVRTAQADGISLAVVEDPAAENGIAVLANRCSHRGGPLSEGKVEGDCIRCPWHSSKFDVATGDVRQGPATMPQPVYEVRTGDRGTEVRRSEPRALRVNSVRPRS